MRRILIWLTAHGYVLAILAIVLSTALFTPGRGDFAKGQWALLYLLIVVLVAGVSGTGPAVLAAVLAFLAWNFFFLPPYRTLEVHDAKDWLSLVAFLAVGIIMGIQTGRMREREERALARERESALLNRLSTFLVSETSTETMAERVGREIVDLLGATSSCLFVPDEGGLRAFNADPRSASPDAATQARAAWAYQHDHSIGLRTTLGSVDRSVETPETADAAHGYVAAGAVCLPLRSPSGVAGVLAVGPRTDARRYSPDDERLLASLANLVAVFLERQSLQAMATKAEALREADRLKSSLLSSVSHELKTPLAALTATASNLLERDVAWDEESVRDQLRSIIGDVTRLNNSIGALLDLSRLEARAWEPRREPNELADVLAASLDALPADQRSRVTLSLPDDLPPLEVDFAQWARVFQNLLENAVLYGGEQGRIMVGAQRMDGLVSLFVEDEGPGVPADEHDAVFEKFYRGRHAVAQAPSGTGLGLAITREIVLAHGGSIHIEDVIPHGARFVITLPLGRHGEVAR